MSKLTAIGRIPSSNCYMICFFYVSEAGCRDMSMPSWEIPAESFEHMQKTVRAFCGIEEEEV